LPAQVHVAERLRVFRRNLHIVKILLEDG